MLKLNLNINYKTKSEITLTKNKVLTHLYNIVAQSKKLNAT